MRRYALIWLSPRNIRVADAFNERGMATFLYLGLFGASTRAAAALIAAVRIGIPVGYTELGENWMHRAHEYRSKPK